MEASGQEGAVGEGDLSVLEHRLTTDDFLSPCWTTDAAARQQALDDIAKQMQDHFEGSGEGAINAAQMVFHLEGVLRHAYSCPFRDVRDKCKWLLNWVAERGHPIPRPLHNSPSWFIPARNIVHFDDPNLEDEQRVLESSFAAKGRASNLFMLMALFPSFAEKYESVYRFVMEGTGPLPMYWRNYLAIMGASRHNCRYLIVQQELQFYANGGEPNWLRGVSYAPLKLQRIAQLNALLAHQPWLVTPAHLDALISGNETDNWSIPELLQAVMILVLFHTLAGFAWGLGVVPEIDREGGVIGRANESPLFSPSSPGDTGMLDSQVSAARDVTQKTNELVEKLNKIKLQMAKQEEGHDGEDDDGTRPRERSVDELQQRRRQFEETERDSSPAMIKMRRLFSYAKYWGGVDMKHTDFDVKSSEYRVFRLQDYSWEDHGFSLINRYYPGVAELLDLLFTETRSMTEYSLFDSRDVDTAPFREAIWYYIFRLKGMFHDDYEYAQVNQMLDKTIKSYLKNVACVPENITQNDFNFMGVKLLDREKVHVNVLLMEARHQAETLYILNALMRLKGE